jgi:hypothetical protein
MPTKPCSCTKGHRYFRSQAEKLNFICDRDGRPITCPVPKGSAASPKSSKSDGKKKPGA